MLIRARDTYHDADYFRREADNHSFGNVGRGNKRYDPHTRRYVKWSIDQDWHGNRYQPNPEPTIPWKDTTYPRFTRDEWRKLIKQWRKNGGWFDTDKMGTNWTTEGPKVGITYLKSVYFQIVNTAAAISRRAQLVLAERSSSWRKLSSGLPSKRGNQPNARYDPKPWKRRS